MTIYLNLEEGSYFLTWKLKKPQSDFAYNDNLLQYKIQNNHVYLGWNITLENFNKFSVKEVHFSKYSFFISSAEAANCNMSPYQSTRYVGGLSTSLGKSAFQACSEIILKNIGHEVVNKFESTFTTIFDLITNPREAINKIVETFKNIDVSLIGLQKEILEIFGLLEKMTGDAKKIMTCDVYSELASFSVATFGAGGLKAGNFGKELAHFYNRIKSKKNILKFFNESSVAQRNLIAYVEHLRDISFGKALKAQNFGSDNLLKSHFEKHGAKLGAQSPEEYLEKAKAFAANKNDNLMSVATDENRRIAKFNPATGEFLVVANDGKILTYFVNSNREQGFIDMINAGKGLKHTSTKKSSLPSSLDVSDL